MQQTTNYQLNQWDPEDRILRTDFNSDNQKLDTALKEVQTAVAGKGNCQIAWGTYTGTGTCGEDAPNRLTFAFEPKLVVIQNAAGAMTDLGASDSYDRPCMILIRTLTRFHLDENTNFNVISWTGKTLSWYNSSNVKLQMNVSGNTYLYAAFG